MGAPIYQMDTMNQVKKDKKPDSNSLEEQNKKTEKEKIAKAAEKKRLNTKTTETEAKTVKQGKLSRKQTVKDAKDAARKKRNDVLDKPTSYSDPTGLTNETTPLEGAKDKRKVARANKRQEMRDIRNKERGARRTDRANRSIKRIGDRNDMTVGEATKAYNTRQEALGGYKKGERGPNPANVDKQTDLDAEALARAKKSEAERLKQEGNKGQYEYTPTDGAGSTNVDVPELKSGIKMLDTPTQQEASEDSQGISSYMNNSENRRGR